MYLAVTPGTGYSDTLTHLAPYVRTAGGLIAFVSLVAYLAYRSKLASMTSMAHDGDPEKLEQILGVLSIPPENWEDLPPAMRKQIILEEVRSRHKGASTRMYCMTILGLALLVAAFVTPVTKPGARATVPVENLQITVNGETDRVRVKRGECLTMQAAWRCGKMPAGSGDSMSDTFSLIWRIDPPDPFSAGFLPKLQVVPFEEGKSGALGPVATIPIADDIPVGSSYDIHVSAIKYPLGKVSSNRVQIIIE